MFCGRPVREVKETQALLSFFPPTVKIPAFEHFDWAKELWHGTVNQGLPLPLLACLAALRKILCAVLFSFMLTHCLFLAVLCSLCAVRFFVSRDAFGVRSLLSFW